MTTPFRLDGLRALVTGGASGIGEETCRVLTAAGAAVTIADIDRPRAEALSMELPGSSVLVVDVTDEPGFGNVHCGRDLYDDPAAPADFSGPGVSRG